MYNEKEENSMKRISSRSFAKSASFAALFIVMLLINVAAAMAYYQSHNLSEIRNIDTNLNLKTYQLNASTVNTTQMYLSGGRLGISIGSATGNTLYWGDRDISSIFNGCTNCVDSSEVSFNYAGSTSKGGAAASSADLSCTNCVGSGDVDATAVQLRVTGTCVAGSSIRVIDQAGTVSCETDDVGLLSESDPQVGTLGGAGSWCTTDGSAVNCQQSTPDTSTTNELSSLTCTNAASSCSGSGTIAYTITGDSTGDCDSGYFCAGGHTHSSYLTSESDPQVGTLGGAGSWCTTDGSAVNCQQSAPVTGSGTATRVAFWDSASSISSNANLYWDNSNSRLGVGTSTPSTALHVQGGTIIGNNSGPGAVAAGTGIFGTGSVYGVYGYGTNAVYGYSQAFNGYGVYGTSAGASGIGVYGSAASGVAGVVGNRNGAGTPVSGSGVYGTGSTYGVLGQYNTNNYGYLGDSVTGVYGRGGTYGGYFYSDDNAGTNNYGVNAYAANAGTWNYGGFFTASGATNNVGVVGTSSGSGTNNYGGSFTASGATNNYGLNESVTGGASTNNYGVVGVVTGGAFSTAYGAYFNVSGLTAYGIYANASSGGGSGVGVYGWGSSTGGSFVGKTGVYGEATDNGVLYSYGGRFVSGGTPTAAVRAEVDTNTYTNLAVDDGLGAMYGVRSYATAAGDTTHYGGYFESSGATTNYGVYGDGTNYGVYGAVTDASGSNYGVYGLANSSSTDNYGVLGSATGTSGDRAGVVGRAAAGSSGGAIGVFGTTATGSITIPSDLNASAWLITSPVVIGLYSTMNKTNINGEGDLYVAGLVEMDGLAQATSAYTVYWQPGGAITRTASSAKYKKDIANYSFNVEDIAKLRPVTFKYNNLTGSDNVPDFGLIAEEVNQTFPELVVYDEKGWPDAVKYDHLGVVLIKVAQEQQKTIESQQQQIIALKSLVCLDHPDADICK